LRIPWGIPLFWELHWQRLQHSFTRLGFRESSLDFDLRAALRSVIDKNALCDGAVRITFTAGQQQEFIATQSLLPTVILHATPLPEATPFLDAITVPEQRDALKDLKLTYRVINMLAEQQAQRQGAQVALFTEEGMMIEATVSNVFSLDTNGAFITPSLYGKGLNGICRQIILHDGYGLALRWPS